LIEKHKVGIGNIIVGANNDIIVQSMINTDTGNINSSIHQITELAEAGCQIVRITCRTIKEAQNLKEIKSLLLKKGIETPLVADIHFNPKVAEHAALYADKIRINPGNYVDKRREKSSFSDEDFLLEKNNIKNKLTSLVEICRRNSTSIRIGVNHGSLSERMMFAYGNTAKGMLESALEFIEIFRELNFHDLVISLKASHVPIMIEANRLMYNEFRNRGFVYPIHLGITEAGSGIEARVKSAAGIGSLLAENIGDTIRVSLTEDPIEEIPFAKKLITKYGNHKRMPLPRFKKNNADNFELILNYNNKDEEDLLINASVDFTRLYNKKAYKKLKIFHDGKEQCELADTILQALGVKYSKAEIIACPSCGRTLFNIIDELKRVKKKTSHLKGVKIAVMGCIVNGIGEMAGADFGYVGAGKGKVDIYKEKLVISKNIDVENAVDELVRLIRLSRKIQGKEN
jgi:(E)-4-hydroxy-3-methylbut-2-enyl-diphosphate synthase